MNSLAHITTLSSDRVDLALHASWEIGDLLDAFQDIKHQGDGDAYICAMRLFQYRVKELNSVVMSVLGGDDARETKEMKKVLELTS